MTRKTDRHGDPETQTIAHKAQQLDLARKRRRNSAWYGLGMFGLVGWSVAVPVVAGVALGLWIDRRWPSDVSWTLTLLLAGAVLGAFNAWYWTQREGRDD
jgi:ATP synthase protein I